MAQILDRRCEYRIWWENFRERDYLEHLGIDGRMILKRSGQGCALVL
jgi:hypothetical protein